MKKKDIFSSALAISVLLPTVTSAVAAPADVSVASVDFIGMDAPNSAKKMAIPYTDASVKVTYSNGKTETFPLTYKELFNTGDEIVGSGKQKFAAGTPIDANKNPITDKSKLGLDVNYISDAPDANSLLNPINGSLYLVSHLEYDSEDAAGNDAYGRIPASMTLTKLYQNKETGELKVISGDKVDFSKANGLWIPCNGSLSPWNTHLGSEEYEPDARLFEMEKNLSESEKQERINTNQYDKTYLKEFATLYFGDEAKANPYLYGYVPEVIINADGTSKVIKHYSVGRKSTEIMRMMPDNKTAYFGDDGSYTMLFMYVADKAADLSAGTLYAAKFNQTSAENGGKGQLEWIQLGHATDAEVEEMAKKYSFSDIFETSTEPKDGFTAIKQYTAIDSDYGDIEYLKLKPGMEKAAAFLESRRYGALLGATSEFNKMEGIAVNASDKKVYVALADASKGTDTNEKDPTDHIKGINNKAGIVYELNLAGGQKDSAGKTINSNFVSINMEGLLAGKILEKPDAYGNTADPNKIASPDNLSYSEAMRTLFIGEDSGYHVNNFVWAYNIDKKELDRILSVPAGAEATGLMAADNRSGFSYIMSNFQHAGDGLGKKEMTAVNKDELIKAIEKGPYGVNKYGAVGYIHGLPSFTINK